VAEWPKPLHFRTQVLQQRSKGVGCNVEQVQADFGGVVALVGAPSITRVHDHLDALRRQSHEQHGRAVGTDATLDARLGIEEVAVHVSEHGRIFRGQSRRCKDRVELLLGVD